MQQRDRHTGMSLYERAGGRKYLNAAERRRFLRAAQRAEPAARLFCLVLNWSGARISEILALTAAAIDIDSGVANIETLKRRKPGVFRQVPLPRHVLRGLDRSFRLRSRQRDPNRTNDRLWTWSRTTAWRRIKKIMAAAKARRNARHTQRIASWIRCQRISVERAASPCPTLDG